MTVARELGLLKPGASAAAFDDQGPQLTTVPAITDSSTRFVLPADAPLLRNLAVLWVIDPALAAAIEALGETQDYCIEPSKSGKPTVTIETADGRSVYLHSKYQPVEEARKLLTAVDCSRQHVFYFHGFGLGYVVDEVFDRAGAESMLCLFEPDLRIIRAMLEARDISDMIESGRVHFFWNLDKADLYTRLMPNTALVSMGTESIVHSSSESLCPEFHRQMRVWLEEFAAFCRTNMNTLVLNGRVTAENVTRNIARYLTTGDAADLKDLHRKRPAVIVSAGPSLRKNRHLIKELQGKAVIIAVQTTLQPLLEMGIEPDYVTSLDYHDICARFYERLPAKLHTHLIAEAKATERIFELFPGRVTVVGNDFAESLLREMKPDKLKVPAGSTVAHLAFYAAELMGCDPIIFVGQDLGFSDGLCYTPGTSYDDVWRPELGQFCTMEMKQWEQIVRDRPILRKINDVFGRPMYTEERLFTYLQQFERDFLKSDRTIIDATEGGASKRGTTVLSFREAIDRYVADIDLPSTEATEALVKPASGRVAPEPIRRAIECLNRREAEAKIIEQIGVDTRPLLEEIRDNLSDQGRVNRAIGRIDALRARINEVGQTYDLVTQLTQAAQMKRFEADRAISAAKLDAQEKQRRQVGRDIQNVASVTEAARDFQKLLAETIHTLSLRLPEEK